MLWSLRRKGLRIGSGATDDTKPADIVTVSESLERSNELETAGGLAYLGSPRLLLIEFRRHHKIGRVELDPRGVAHMTCWRNTLTSSTTLSR
jgi:hypothetical protein